MYGLKYSRSRSGLLLITVPSSAGAKLRISTTSAGKCGIAKGYVECVDLGVLVSPVLLSSATRDRFVGGGLKKVSSVLGRFAVSILYVVVPIWVKYWRLRL
jgi:hypothetical protein